jgi:heterotetrameric sarcosine oxidase gamma subunit
MKLLDQQRSLPTPFHPLTAAVDVAGAILRLTPNDWMVLLNPGETTDFLAEINSTAATVIDVTGALGCFALAGPNRMAVLERSTALNLRTDHAPPGSVRQTTIHTIRCTLYRRPELDLILHPRSFSESLFEALLDVGMGVGLLPTGLGTLPIYWIP